MRHLEVPSDVGIEQVTEGSQLGAFQGRAHLEGNACHGLQIVTRHQPTSNVEIVYSSILNELSIELFQDNPLACFPLQPTSEGPFQHVVAHFCVWVEIRLPVDLYPFESLVGLGVDERDVQCLV